MGFYQMLERLVQPVVKRLSLHSPIMITLVERVPIKPEPEPDESEDILSAVLRQSFRRVADTDTNWLCLRCCQPATTMGVYVSLHSNVQGDPSHHAGWGEVKRLLLPHCPNCDPAYTDRACLHLNDLTDDVPVRIYLFRQTEDSDERDDKVLVGEAGP